MEALLILIQVVIALGILNVWILRYSSPTEFRGGSARTMPEEFQVYGLPSWSLPVVGSLKVLLATLLILGVWFPEFTQPAAIGMAVLMAGAVLMHVKVGDQIKKTVPALVMLLLCVLVAV